MKQEKTLENLNLIREMVRQGGTPLFFMAVSHLFDCGISSFSVESYRNAVKAIEENHKQAEAEGKIRIMTLEYEKAVLDTAYRLSKLPLFDVLLYIKKHMEIGDPETADANEVANLEEDEDGCN